MTQPPQNHSSTLSQARFDTAYLSEILSAVFHLPVEEITVTPLQGDASDRIYFRLTFRLPSENQPERSAILMQLQKPVESEDTDFTSILKFLRKLELPVPRLYHYDSGRGLIFLEDCGPHTLEDELRDHPEKTETYYRQAVELLTDLHHRATRSIGPDCPAHSLRFDVEKLMWELDFMIENYVVTLKQRPLSQNALKELRGALLPLCETLAAEELCFTHRDYHCRNLMAKNGDLFILDFQDARMGPCQYDLASLLKDSYLSLPSNFRAEMIELFIRLKEKNENRTLDRESFHKIFDMMSIQRNLKAVGTFAFQSVARKNDRYLQYIPLTFSYVTETLARRSDLVILNRVLNEHIPGLRAKPSGNRS